MGPRRTVEMVDDCSKREARNRAKRTAYALMSPEKKTAFLAKQRHKYSLSKSLVNPQENVAASVKKRASDARADAVSEACYLDTDSLGLGNVGCLDVPVANKRARRSQVLPTSEDETALLMSLTASQRPSPLGLNNNNICGSCIFSDGERVRVISARSSVVGDRILHEPLVCNLFDHKMSAPRESIRGESSISTVGDSLLTDTSLPPNHADSDELLGSGLIKGQPSILHGRKVYDIRNVPDKPFVLKKANPCSLCGAYLFHGESLKFCCSEGEVSLPYNEPPDELWQLFMSNGAQAIAFQNFIRAYNNLFAMTSLGLTYDATLATSIGTGVYTFKVQGQVYHFVNRLLPDDGRPTHMQLYYYDPNHETENRARILNLSNTDIVKALSKIVSSSPYCAFFKSLQNVPDLANTTIVIKSFPQLNQNVYNKPSVSDVAFIWSDDQDGLKVGDRDIVVHGLSDESHRVNYYFGCYDPLQYPLLFPNGESGWHPQIHRCAKLKDRHLCKGVSDVEPARFTYADDLLDREKRALRAMKEDRSGYVSIREYYAYMFQMRARRKNLPLAARRLLQQFCVDMYIKLESNRLDFFRLNQDLIRAELYQGLVEALVIGETEAVRVGKRIVLPGSFIGGPRDMRRRYLDAMALVRKYGKPDIFLTLTCNGDWPEIVEHLEPGQTVQDRPDLVARVFKSKLRQLKHEVLEMHIFGRVVAHVYVVEFQKRGMPHVHMLLILDRSAKMTTPASFDKVVSAELPNPDTQPYLFSLVKKHMMHGPCGPLNKSNICMQENGQCRSHYPKPYQQHTSVGINEYPLYRRKNNGRVVDVRRHSLDNRWVVPYNPYLLAKFNCHLNVEICSTVKAVKYLYKYIYKGHDKVAFCLTADANSPTINEIDAFQSGRWVAPPEAMWRIFGFNMYSMKPSVMTLQLHLEDQQNVVFRPIGKVKTIVDNENSTKTTLTEFFKANSESPVAKSLNLLYTEFPTHFTWNQTTKSWKPRKSQTSIGRIYNISPTEGEKYYLRRLLTCVRGPTSYIDLKTVGGVILSTFREAAEARGLVQTDTMVDNCLQDSEIYQMPCGIRNLFAILLVHCNPPNVLQLWKKYLPSMAEDFLRGNGGNIDAAEIEVLLVIQKNLESKGKSLEHYGLPNPNVDGSKKKRYKELEDEEALAADINDLMSVDLLNAAQRIVYDSVMEKVHANKPGAFFLDGPGGTGKTFVYKAIIATIRSQKQIALATATSGVAASLLPGGRTAHSRFKIPIDSHGNTACNVSKISGTASLLKKAKVIIWDEAAMAKKESIEAVDALLQDLHENKLPFGGKVILFGGDFRQVLPVVYRGSKEDLIAASLVKSYVWSQLEKFHLTENMRAKLDPSFSRYLMRVGDGVEPLSRDGSIQLPRSIVIDEVNHDQALDSLIDFVFPDIGSKTDQTEHLSVSGILTPTNTDVDKLNAIMLTRFPGDMKVYNGVDETTDPNQQGQYEDLLHSFLPNGMPPYELRLKLNCPAMILRNIDPANGLCNGTRVICRAFHSNMIYVEIAVGARKGEKVMVPRIPMIPPSNEEFPVSFKRTQFPIRPSFAMTINKAQGQTLNVVGLYLPQPVFSHGQLYVALSRVKLMSTVKVLAAHAFEDGTICQQTRNVVYHEILNLAQSQNCRRISKKTDSKGTTQFKKLVLMDTQGDKIQATIFKQDESTFDDMLFPFEQYMISNATIARAPEKYKMFTTPFQLTIHKKTIVETTDEGDFRQLNLINLVPFSGLHKFIDSDEGFDMMFAIAITLPPREVISKGEPATVQEFIVIDEEFLPVKMTFWDNMAKNEGADIVKAKHIGLTVVLINRIRSTTFEGFSMAARQASTIAINPPLSRAKELHHWFMENSGKANTTARSCLQKGYRSIIPTMIPQLVVPLNQVSEKAEQKTYIWVSCSITIQDQMQNFFDIICNICDHVVAALGGRKFRCNSCRNMATAVPKVRLLVRLADDTGSLTAEIDGDLAEAHFSLSGNDLMVEKNEHKFIPIEKFPSFNDEKKVTAQLRSYITKVRGIPARRYFIYHIDGFSQPSLLSSPLHMIRDDNPAMVGFSTKGKEVVEDVSNDTMLFSGTPACAESQIKTNVASNLPNEIVTEDLEVDDTTAAHEQATENAASKASTPPTPSLITPDKEKSKKQTTVSSTVKRRLEVAFPDDDEISVDNSKSTPPPTNASGAEAKKVIPAHLIKQEKP